VKKNKLLLPRAAVKNKSDSYMLYFAQLFFGAPTTMDFCLFIFSQKVPFCKQIIFAYWWSESGLNAFLAPLHFPRMSATAENLVLDSDAAPKNQLHITAMGGSAFSLLNIHTQRHAYEFHSQLLKFTLCQKARGASFGRRLLRNFTT
jgi:hypothetical protein